MMKNLIAITIFLISFQLHANQSSEYTLAAGDQIRILVYDEADLTLKVLISDDGKINFPLIGNINVSGKTTKEVQRLVHNGLKGDYLLNPSVQVDIMTYRPFYIHGEVKKPGAYAYQPGLTVDQAVALGGGFTERASTSKIYIEKALDNKPQKKNVSLTYVVSPGDTITIEQSFF
jgi:polysaccharide biosynthesis/export protein VpsN